MYILWKNVTKRARFRVGRPCSGSSSTKKRINYNCVIKGIINESIRSLSLILHIYILMIKFAHTIRISLLRISWFESRVYFVVAKFILSQSRPQTNSTLTQIWSELRVLPETGDSNRRYIDVLNSIEYSSIVGASN